MQKKISIKYRVLCPLSRTIIIGLNELKSNKKISSTQNVNMLTEDAVLLPFYHIDKIPETITDTSSNNMVPMMTDENNISINGSIAIGVYLKERFLHESPVTTAQTLWGSTISEKTKIMHYWLWFEQDFFNEVIYGILYNRVFIPRMNTNYKCDLELLKTSRNNLKNYLTLLNDLFAQQDFIASNNFSWADAAFVAHMSCLEYFSEIQWIHYKALKNSYIRMKSRLSFRDLLAEKIYEITPPKDYAALDY